MKALFGMLLIVGVLFSIANVTTEGGNVTGLYLNTSQNSSYWDGLYGDVVLGAGTTYNHTVNGNNITLLNMVGQDPPCNYTGLSMQVIAVNNSAIALPLVAGNLAQLDGFMGGGENGSSTFTLLSTFTLNSGTYNNVPTTYSYANGAPSASFREGYMNDALGNLVFVADVVSNQPNWNGSTSDYQIMLPNDGSGVQYWLWVEVNYTCTNVTPPHPSDHEHKLYVPPIPTQTMTSGTPLDVPVTVENRGDYREDDVEVSVTNCPSGFTCEIVVIPKISKGEDEQITLEINGGPPGSYVLEVCADNIHTNYCREFILNVLPECEDEECTDDEYCEGGEWIGKKDAGEECEIDCECLSGLCENGICVLCEIDADCPDDEECSDGFCEKVECPCGIVQNHACIPYECCSDSDCESDQFCIDFECVVKELEIILIDGELIVGEEGLFQILNNRGEEVPFADVFTNEEDTVADEHGYASLPFTPDGLVYADAEGYQQVAKLFDVIQIGIIEILAEDVMVGEETTITIVDRDGNPIVGAEVHIEGNVLITDANGQVKYTFDEPGTKTIMAFKPGYLINDANIDVGEPGAIPAEGVCRFPFWLRWFSIPAPDITYLWLFSLVLGVFNFFAFRRRIKRNFLKCLVKQGLGNWKAELKNRNREIYFKGLVYSFLPLVFALPGMYILNICFMSNIVLLEAIAETAIILKKKFGKKVKMDEELEEMMREV
ncbi:MAG: hypothetical protein GY852_02825 [bacterium]|nr:hypothetical protein [bacterium]